VIIILLSSEAGTGPGERSIRTQRKSSLLLLVQGYNYKATQPNPSYPTPPPHQQQGEKKVLRTALPIAMSCPQQKRVAPQRDGEDANGAKRSRALAILDGEVKQEQAKASRERELWWRWCKVWRSRRSTSGSPCPTSTAMPACCPSNHQPSRSVTPAYHFFMEEGRWFFGRKSRTFFAGLI
jgi:hypothetical protein